MATQLAKLLAPSVGTIGTTHLHHREIGENLTGNIRDLLFVPRLNPLDDLFTSFSLFNVTFELLTILIGAHLAKQLARTVLLCFFGNNRPIIER